MKPRKFTDLTASEKSALIETLAASQNMSDFLQVLERNFELNTCIPNNVTKQIIARGMVNMILPMINPIKK
jgi:hypothetical protein